jgi:hypothetical protein
VVAADLDPCPDFIGFLVPVRDLPFGLSQLVQRKDERSKFIRGKNAITPALTGEGLFEPDEWATLEDVLREGPRVRRPQDHIRAIGGVSGPLADCGTKCVHPTEAFPCFCTGAGQTDHGGGPEAQPLSQGTLEPTRRSRKSRRG